MIIALDTEETLRSLGVAEVAVQATVAEALEELTGSHFDLAVVDFNLGEETSERIIAALRARETPFWLATGYTEMAESSQALGAQGLLLKPYGEEELAAMLAGFAAMQRGG